MEKINPDNTGMKYSARQVIWDGPDIPCINLCKGDSIQDVVYKLATELCTLLDDAYDASNIDFSCVLEFGSEIATPTTLEETVTLLVTRICELNTIINDESVANIDLPECLYYTDSGPVTSLPPDEYAAYLASKICDILSSISTIQEDITLANTNISVLDVRLTSVEQQLLELGVADYMVTGTCINPSEVTIQEGFLALEEAFCEILEQAFCELRTSTGTASQIDNAVGLWCNISAEAQLNDAGVMSDLTGWTSSPATLAASFGNLWLTLCDLREAYVSTSGAVPFYHCGDVILDFEVAFTGINRTGISVTLANNSFIPPTWTNTGTNTITITDGITSDTNSFDTVAVYGGTPYTLAFGVTNYTHALSEIDPTLPLTITIVSTVTDGTTTCSKTQVKTYYPTYDAPASVSVVNTTPGTAVITIAKPVTGIPIGYRVTAIKDVSPTYYTQH